MTGPAAPRKAHAEARPQPRSPGRRLRLQLLGPMEVSTQEDPSSGSDSNGITSGRSLGQRTNTALGRPPCASWPEVRGLEEAVECRIVDLGRKRGGD